MTNETIRAEAIDPIAFVDDDWRVLDNKTVSAFQKFRARDQLKINRILCQLSRVAITVEYECIYVNVWLVRISEFIFVSQENSNDGILTYLWKYTLWYTWKCYIEEIIMSYLKCINKL